MTASQSNGISSVTSSKAPPSIDTSKSQSDAFDSLVSPTVDVRIKQIRPLLPPAVLLEELPANRQIQRHIYQSRQASAEIIHGRDDRLLVIVGPCSVHDSRAALEYAQRLAVLVRKYSTTLHIIMRVYFEKPRTTVGWKGLINDPALDGSFAINTGLRLSRKLLIDINSLGVAVAGEILDTISPQFLADLIAWGAIGARTTECQLHRELTSGLSFPVGFKNGTTGSIKIATDAIIASSSPHCFLSVTTQALAAIVETRGNADCHLVLRGSDSGPNYSAQHVAQAAQDMTKAKLKPSIMIDCSHGNSEKKHVNQSKVVQSICSQLSSNDGAPAIIGCMIESNLVAGNQKLTLGQADKLTYGQSITDACIDWQETEKLLADLAKAVDARRAIATGKQ